MTKNAELYDAALKVVMRHIDGTPKTRFDLWVECGNELPDGITWGKFIYLLRKYHDALPSHDAIKYKTYTVA